MGTAAQPVREPALTSGGGLDQSGTVWRSASQARAFPSDGARQSPRGESDPPASTLGPLGIADRLNWLKPK